MRVQNVDEKTDLDDDEIEQDEQRPAAVNASDFIGTLGSQRLQSQSRQETEAGKPAISSQSVFYKHKRNMTSFDNSQLDLDSRNMTQILGFNSSNVEIDKD